MGDSNVYCHACGTKNTTGARVCTRCGTKLLTNETQRAPGVQTRAETAAGLEPRMSPGGPARTPAPAPKSKGAGLAFAIIIPMLLLGVVFAGLALLYKYELQMNRDVEALQEKAQAEALEGRYVKALALLNAAVAKRPNYEALTQDRAVTAEAAEWQEKLKSAAEGLKKQKLQASEATINTLAKALAARKEPVFTALRKELAADQTLLAVMKVKSELDKLNTVDELAAKLDSVAKLKGNEAEAVKKQIISKLAGLSYSAAEKLLKKKDFAGALKAVDKGLSYAPENEKLSTYRKRIQSEKLAFEKAEQERIELAAQQAAEEDLNNRTAAVEVKGIHVTLDEYGDLQISGTISNKATRTIYSVDLSLGIYDESGNDLGQAYVGVNPYRIAPGESGDFTTTYYGVYEQAQVSVVNATWYLE